MARQFISYKDAIALADAIGGIVYQLTNGSHYVVAGNAPHPVGAKEEYQAKNLSPETIINWIAAM